MTSLCLSWPAGTGVISLSDRNPYEVHAELVQRITRLEAEVERLRAALEKIEAGYGQRLSAAELASIARQTL